MNKSFEDQWKDALGDASQTPPPEIWDRVEAELNKKKNRFILWRNPVILSGVAALVALVLGTTLFLMNTPAPERSISQQTGTPVKTPVKTQHSADEKPKQAPALSPPLNEDPAPSKNGSPVSINRPVTHVFSSQAKEEQVSLPVQPALTGTLREKAPAAENINSASYDRLTPLPFKPMQAYASLPSVQAPVEDSPVSRKAPKEKKIRIGFIAANAPFNPNFSTPGFQQQALMAVQNSDVLLSFDKGGPGLGGNSFYTSSNRTDAQSTFKRGQSMSFGLTFGRKLKKRLSLESGLKFTRATTTLTSNVYAVNKATGETESFSHANYLRSEKEMSDVLISVNGTSHYSYHFLSVPLLLNYEILNLGKLHVSAVGGLSSEFLISGTVVSSKQNEQHFNAGNSNFRPVNIAGLGGLRLSYPVTSVLDINLGGMYQHFLTSGLQKNTEATFRPSMLGINLGLSVRQ